MSHTVLTSAYVECQTKNYNLRLIPITDEIIRCITSPKEICPEAESLIIEKKTYPQVPFTVEESETTLLLKTKKVHAEICPVTGNIRWMHPDGTLWAQDTGKEFQETEVFQYTIDGEQPIIDRVKTVDGERNFIRNLKKEKSRTAYHAKLYFQWQNDEALHGLGQAEEGIYNYRGQIQYLYQHNMRIPMPLLVSSKGYGLLFDCCSLMTFRDDEKESYLFFDAALQADYYFLGGETMDGIIHDYRFLTGKAQMLPKWAYGYIQSKEQYYSAKELSDIVRRYRTLQVPLDCVVQDWNSWRPGHWGEKSLDPARYGDIKERLQEIHEMHAHSMISIWPNMNAGTKDYEEFLEQKLLLTDLSTYNAFDENARALYWKQMKRELFDSGFDSWWCDSTEPFSGPDWNGSVKREASERYELVGSEHKKYLDATKANAFALMHAKGIYENQRKESEERRVLNLTRSGYASIQKYGVVLWSGDICASWKTLRTQIVEGLNMGLSGYPYWTLDIGGFFVVNENWKNRGCGCNQDPEPKWFWKGDYEEGVNDLGYRELYTRWLQLGVFLPIFRSHGTDTPREIWNFGEPGTLFYDAIEKFIKLRYRLMPYLYSMAANVYLKDDTMMRSLLFDFPEDETAVSLKDAFMFGSSLLVCPVTEPLYYDRESRELHKEKVHTCYLPKGCSWYDFWTNERYEGGQYVTVPTPIDHIPLFVKAGSILPVTEGLQYAMQEMGTPMKLLIYTGADADFTCYEDDGTTYAFEQGAYATTHFCWKDKEARFYAEERKGSYPGMKELHYEIEIIR